MCSDKLPDKIMSDSKIINLSDAQKKQPQKTGWSQQEIANAAARELQQFEQLTADEPEHLVAGDMQGIIEDTEHDTTEDN